MLLQFAVENFRSFREKQTFSMLVAEDSKAAPNTYVEVAGKKVLRVAALYGANAAGKSNLVKAFEFLRDLVVEGRSKEEKIGIEVFRPKWDGAAGVAFFQVDFLVESEHFSYGVTASVDRIAEEWLMRIGPDGREDEVFTRTTASDDSRSVSLTPGAFFPADRRPLVELIATSTRPNQLFLHEAVEHRLDELESVRGFFSRQVVALDPPELGADFAGRVHQDAQFRESVVRLLRAADLGIESLETVVSADDPAAALWTVVRGAKDRVRRKLAIGTFDAGGNEEQVMVLIVHRGEGGLSTPFVVIHESEGTQRLLALANILYPTHREPSFAAFDELERSLHPLLARHFLREFLAQPATNRHQLLFTTHDTSLLSADLLPNEAVWFAKKTEAGATTLYSLLEFDPAQLERLRPNLEQGYLHGRFGAIPFITQRRADPAGDPEEGE